MTNITRKTDSSQISEFVRELQQQGWLGEYRRWWPEFGFHFTDIHNVINILQCGHLYSRQRIKELDLNFIDGASSEIIDRTYAEGQNQVRFYFRPRTPTQYRNEGLRPTTQFHELNAHLPVPVFLLFDLVDLLTRDNCSFSNRSIATAMFATGQNVDFLRSLPFKDIYHDTYLPDEPSRKAEIIARRHAEILIPTELDLSGLSEIHCRSTAEKDTLLFLLRELNIQGWQDKIFSDSRRQLFFKKWTYVDKVLLGKNEIQIRFSPDTVTPGPFQLNVSVSDIGEYTNDNFNVRENTTQYILTLNLPQQAAHYVCTITIDSHLVYKNEFIDYEIPF